MKLNNLRFHYTSATILAILGALIAVAVSFGLHLTQDNINSVMKLAGLLLGLTVVGGGFKSAGLVRAGVPTPDFHYTSATIVAMIGTLITLAVSFGLHLSQENIDSVMTLVGLIAGGIVVGGGVKSGALLTAGTHPALTGTRNSVSPPRR